ncbi:MAG: phage tail protein [Saprospiraceae bacterium]|nr:phage tail protein [Saprospiraceae bacterium]
MLGFTGLFENNANLPLLGFHFRVDFLFNMISPVDAKFSEVEGLNSKFTFGDEVREMGIMGGNHKLPNGREFGPLILKRGITSNISMLINWYEISLLALKIVPQPLVVTLLDENHEPKYSWMIFDAYPISMDVSGFDSNKSAYVIETFTLRYSYFTRLNAANPLSNILMKGLDSISNLF